MLDTYAYTSERVAPITGPRAPEDRKKKGGKPRRASGGTLPGLPPGSAIIVSRSILDELRAIAYDQPPPAWLTPRDRGPVFQRLPDRCLEDPRVRALAWRVAIGALGALLDALREAHLTADASPEKGTPTSPEKGTGEPPYKEDGPDSYIESSGDPGDQLLHATAHRTRWRPEDEIENRGPRPRIGFTS